MVTSSKARVLLALSLPFVALSSAMATTPAAAVKGLTAWYDLGDSTTITFASGSAVSAVSDKSGNGNQLTQSTTSAQPSLSTYNSLQGLIFSGGQQLLSSTTNTFASGSSPSTVFTVAAYTGSTSGSSSYAFTYTYGAGNNNKERGLAKRNGAAGVNCQEYWADITLGTNWSSTPSLVYASYGSSTESCAQNGATATTASYTPQTPTSTALYLGSQFGGSGWFGPIFEVLMYNATLSPTERQFVEGYLACKWSLTLSVGHPYSSYCPSAATPTMSLTLSQSPTTGGPGTIVTYTTTLTNSSGTLVYSPIVTCPVPNNTWFELNSQTQSLTNTGLAAAVTYSSNNGSTYTYTPVSAGGGAPSGYDANVTDVRWTLNGSVGPAPSINSGTVSYGVRIQ